MNNGVPPSIIFITGALLVPLLKGRIKTTFMLLLPVVSMMVLIRMPEGQYWTLSVLDYKIVLGQVDKLGLLFGYIFTIVAFIGILFALKVNDNLQHACALIYAGSALGVTFSGDYFSLYVFWELLAISSTFLILARKTKASQSASLRYVLVHIFGGLCLLAGIIVTITNANNIALERLTLDGAGSYLIFIGIALNAGVPPLHAWLVDAYPEATPTGAVFMSAITTKSAVYVMARLFPGTEMLIWLGAFMVIYPILFALIVDDIRKILSYSIINQGGFMMIGIGIGTALSLNGAVSHAFCCVIYTALLFMVSGSVIEVTGKSKCSELGGLYKKMPLTCLFCIVGGASISAFPLTSGFISKSMTISAAAHEHLPVIWLLLILGSAGAFLHAGAKITYYTFFSRDTGIVAKDPSKPMLLAMAIAGFLCIFIGIFPGTLYRILPYPVDYMPYTGNHVVGQLQVILLAAWVFRFFQRFGYQMAESGKIYIDIDWFYRLGLRGFCKVTDTILNGINGTCERILATRIPGRLGALSRAPISTIVTYYLKRRQGTSILKDFEKETKPELVNLIPAGIPVLLSIMVLCSIFVVFAFGHWS